MELDEEAKRTWLDKHIANAPVRSDAWFERVMAIYAGAESPLAMGQQEETLPNSPAEKERVERHAVRR